MMQFLIENESLSDEEYQELERLDPQPQARQDPEQVSGPGGPAEGPPGPSEREVP